MTFSFLGPDPVEEQILRVLERLAAGERPGDIEVAQVDIKEEANRRARDGTVTAPSNQSEEAARHLAGEIGCMANTAGGGAIIVGIADDGTRIGTGLDAHWLRHRIWELADRKLTTSVREMDFGGVRLLVVSTPEAIEPIRVAGKIRWRLDDHCVEVDATSWHAGKLRRTGADWSAQPSGHRLNDVSPVAVEIARRYLRMAGDVAAVDLGSASDEDMLRRLNVVDGGGRLTNAGSLLFVETPTAGIDYIRRSVPGGDSANRLRTNRALLEQVSDVDKASQASNRIIQVPDGFAFGQVRAIPERAMREAIVNGVVHRDWLSPEPTTVEHVGDGLTVTSPGGFIGGIEPSNIITHPSVPRYRSLAEAMASLRLAEREGVGVDRMVRDMLMLGHPRPEISEMAGGYVRVGLIGGDPDHVVVDLVSSLEPPGSSADVDALLIIDYLRQWGWIDIAEAVPLLQRPAGETGSSIGRLAAVRSDGAPVIVPLRGVPAGQPAAHRLNDGVRARLTPAIDRVGAQELRNAQILRWAQRRGRVSSTEVADMAGLSVPYAGTLLTAMEGEGLLVPGRKNKVGRGFFYVPAPEGI